MANIQVSQANSQTPTIKQEPGTEHNSNQTNQVFISFAINLLLI